MGARLSPFEVRYDERLQFFTEGTELFEKCDIFYSRRVGSEPKGYDAAEDSLREGEYLSENPDLTQLINASPVNACVTHQINGIPINARIAHYINICPINTGITH